MKTKKIIEERIAIPNGVTMTIQDNLLTIKGKQGELKKQLGGLDCKVDGAELIIKTTKPSKREKTMLGTTVAHIKNAIVGVQEKHTYKLKICSGHFPMSVSIQKGQMIVKNFIGEKVPRALPLRATCDVKLDGEVIVVTGLDKEEAGQMAADIQQRTRRPGFDLRIFQDGIYITEKSGKKI